MTRTEITKTKASRMIAKMVVRAKRMKVRKKKASRMIAKMVGVTAAKITTVQKKVPRKITEAVMAAKKSKTIAMKMRRRIVARTSATTKSIFPTLGESVPEPIGPVNGSVRCTRTKSLKRSIASGRF